MNDEETVMRVLWVLSATASIFTGATAQAAADTADALTHRYEAFEKTREE